MRYVLTLAAILSLFTSQAFAAASLVPAFSTFSGAGMKVNAGKQGTNTMQVIGATFSKPGGKPTMTVTAPFVRAESYASLNAAVAAIGSTPTTLSFSTNQTPTGTLTIPATLELMPINGAVINHGSYTISYAGSTERWPNVQIFNGTGAVTGIASPHIEWFHSSTYANAFVKAVNCANGGVTRLSDRSYDLAGIEAISAQITEDINVKGPGTLVAAGNKLIVPTGISVTFDQVTFGDWHTPVYMQYAHPLLRVISCIFTGANNRTIYGYPNSMSVASVIDRVELISNTVTGVYNGFDIEAKVGSALVTGNKIKGVSNPFFTRGICIGDPENSDSAAVIAATGTAFLTYQETSGNYAITGNHIEDIHSTSVSNAATNAIIACGNNITVSNNTIKYIHSSSPTQCEAIYTKAINTVVTNNTIIDGTLQSGNILAKGFPIDSAAKPVSYSHVIAFNTILAMAQNNFRGIDTYGSDTLIFGNFIKGMSQNGIHTVASLDNTLVHENITIAFNQIKDTMGSTAIRSTADKLRNYSVTDNKIDGVKGALSAAAAGAGDGAFGIRIRGTKDFDNVDISRNSITATVLPGDVNSGIVTAIYIQNTLNSTDIRVRDNTIKLTYDGVNDVALMLENGGAVTSKVSITGNNMGASIRARFNSSQDPTTKAAFYPLLDYDIIPLIYADNATATSAGLPVGRKYRTSTGVSMVRY